MCYEKVRGEERLTVVARATTGAAGSRVLRLLHIEMFVCVRCLSNKSGICERCRVAQVVLV